MRPDGRREVVEVYKLYYAPGAASLAVHWMLIEMRLPFEAVRLDLEARQHKEASYLALNPNGLVPTLLVDGVPMYECAAMLLLLADRHPEANLVPPLGGEEHMAYLQWMVHMTNTVQAAFRHWFYPYELAGESAAEAVRASSREVIERAWDRVDKRLAATGAYIAGGSLTAADFLVTMLMRWSRNMPRPAQEWTSIRGYVARMKGRASFRKLYEREGLTEWA